MTTGVTFDSITGRLDVSLENLLPVTSYTITLKFPGPMTVISTFSIEVICGSSTIITSSIMTSMFIYWMDTTENTFSFDPFVCSAAICCTDMNYSIFPASGLLTSFTTDPDSGKIMSSVDV